MTVEHEADVDDTDEALAGWRVIDEGSAAWAVDKVLVARERLARVEAACAAAIADARRSVERAEGFFLPLLQEWYEARPPARGKTIRLTHGALYARTVPGGPRVVDEAAARRWAHRHLPDAIKVKVTTGVSVTALRAYVAATGELPDGVERVAARETYDVKA